MKASFHAKAISRVTQRNAHNRTQKTPCRLTTPLARIHSDWAVSSAVEHCLHTAGVTGSIPVPPTKGILDLGVKTSILFHLQRQRVRCYIFACTVLPARVGDSSVSPLHTSIIASMVRAKVRNTDLSQRSMLTTWGVSVMLRSRLALRQDNIASCAEARQIAANGWKFIFSRESHDDRNHYSG